MISQEIYFVKTDIYQFFEMNYLYSFFLHLTFLHGTENWKSWKV